MIFVRGEEAEYWDTQGAKGARYLYTGVKSYAATEQHAKVNLETV